MADKCSFTRYRISGKAIVITVVNPSYIIKKAMYEGISLKGYIEERAINIANYIIEENATVRQTAKKFGISKSTVHMVVTKWNGKYGE